MKIKGILRKIKEEVKELKEKVKEYKFIIKPTVILTVIYIIGISAILRANFNYIDDLGRINTGNKGWEDASRYLSNFLSTFVHAGNYLTEVSPLPQIIATIILALSGVILLHIITDKKQFPIWQLFATIPLGLSPYFLGCISYKYDAPYMALSILASIFPLLFYKKGNIKYLLITILSILAICTTYQAASGIFPMLVILLSMKLWNEKTDTKEIFKFIIYSIIGYSLGMGIFRFLIMETVKNDSVSNAIAPISIAINNFKQYFSLIKTDFKNIWLILIALICLSFIYVVVRDTKQKRYFALPVAFITLILMLTLTFGMYPLLEQPLFATRTMYGFGAFIAFISTYVFTSKKVYISKVICLSLSWMFFVFAFTYGNALYIQDKYTDYRIAAVIDDLDDLEILDSKKEITVQISGSIGLANSIKHMPQNYQMLNRLIPINFKSDWFWGYYKFFANYGLKNIKNGININLKEQNLSILKDNVYHTIKGNEKYILIELK